VYSLELKKSAADAIVYAATKVQYVWCDAISVTFLRYLDASISGQVFANMAKVYKFYTCIPSLNWVVDTEYCKRGWMWQEYIVGRMLICDAVDRDTLSQILEHRGEKNPHHDASAHTRRVFRRKKMTVGLISELLKSATTHFENCVITKEEDLPNACFGLLKSYGLFEDLPQNNLTLAEFANFKIINAPVSSLNPFRLFFRMLIRVTHEKRAVH
jgi:hypothetical protein